MKITIEFNSESDKDIYNQIRTAGLRGTVSVVVCGVEKEFSVEQYTYWGDGVEFNTEAELVEVNHPKSAEQLAAENFIARAKKSMEAANRALKAAEESLKIVSGK